MNDEYQMRQFWIKEKTIFRPSEIDVLKYILKPIMKGFYEAVDNKIKQS